MSESAGNTRFWRIIGSLYPMNHEQTGQIMSRLSHFYQYKPESLLISITFAEKDKRFRVNVYQ